MQLLNSGHKNDHVLTTPQVENRRELAEATPSVQEVSPLKRSLNIEPLPEAREEELEPALEPLDMSNQEFNPFFREYLESLDKEMRESFADCDLCLRQMQNGYEAHYLALKKGRDLLGLVLINMDHTYQNDFRAYLRHISVKNLDNFGLLLKLAVQFIWDNLHADTIRVDLYHYSEEEGSTLKASTFIKEALSMQKKGFKWKSIMNDPDSGKRFQIMQMMRPKDYALNQQS